MADFAREGYVVLDHDPRVAAWATAARKVSDNVDTSARRHGRTWFVGVDALPNALDGAVAGVKLAGRWGQYVKPPATWHRAQLSIVYPGYPGRDPDETEAAHRFRRDRFAAHLDGLLPEGPDRRRHLREPHAFILGLPLNAVEAAPLMVWPGSHRIIRRGFSDMFKGLEPRSYGELDVTEGYARLRREVFEQIAPVPVPARPGQAMLLHRHLIHGVAPWRGAPVPDGRQIAYFRPLTDPESWLQGP